MMLSQSSLDNLVQPIIDRQEAINSYVLNSIAKRIREIGNISPSEVNMLDRIFHMGGDVQAINDELARLTGMNVKDIKKLIKNVAEYSYTDTKPFYDYRHKSFIPFEENTSLQRVVNSIAAQTAETYINLSKTSALGLLIRDMKHPKILKFQSIEKAYQSIMDEAIQTVQSGIVDYNTAMSRTMEQLVNSGVRKMYWDSGYSQRLDTAVRRNLMDGIRAINQGVQDETGKQFGADGKEITVHTNSAPDHEPIQGHQFTNEQYENLQSAKSFVDVNGKSFAPIERAIGTLNCRHFTYSIIIGHSKPNYTPEQLEKMIEENRKGYTFPNGKHLTMYECTQKQRELETLIRRNKDGQIAAIEAGNLPLAYRYQNKVQRYTNQYKFFSNACGLSTQMNKTKVLGYKKLR